MVLGEAARGVIDVMAWVTLRRRVRETRTGWPSALASNPGVQ